jgi:hypothetical protein
MAGYSPNPLIKKLGIKPGFLIMSLNTPKPYADFFPDWPEDVEIRQTGRKEGVDLIHLFCLTVKELNSFLPIAVPLLKKSGMLWVSWPKGRSGLITDLKRDTIREHLLAIGLVDTKVAAVDDIWSGLKFVYRLKDR